MGMSKNQISNDGALGKTNNRRSLLNTKETLNDMEGAMLTTENPPNMNIVDLCDTISDVEDSEIEQEKSSKHTRKCKRRKVNQPKDKAANPDDDKKEEELFHKEPHRPKSLQS